jgi:hypothetical protein
MKSFFALSPVFSASAGFELGPRSAAALGIFCLLFPLPEKMGNLQINFRLLLLHMRPFCAFLFLGLAKFCRSIAFFDDVVETPFQHTGRRSNALLPFLLLSFCIDVCDNSSQERKT